MRTGFSAEESYINRVAVHSQDRPEDIGLLTGQTGMILRLVLYARKHDLKQFEEIADALYENVVQRAARMSDISFGTGLSGICWGIEYLVQHGFMDGTGQEICEGADKVIMAKNPQEMDDFSLETGLAGLWHYVSARIRGNMAAGLTLPFSDNYLNQWLALLGKHPQAFPAGAAGRLQAAMKGHLEFKELDIDSLRGTK